MGLWEAVTSIHAQAFCEVTAQYISSVPERPMSSISAPNAIGDILVEIRTQFGALKFLDSQ